MPGHVFIVRGNLATFACDAWLLPCDIRAMPRPSWFPAGYSGPRQGPPFPADRRTQRFDAWPGNGPRPWLTNTGGMPRTDSNPGTPLSWYMEAVQQFLEEARRDVVS